MALTYSKRLYLLLHKNSKKTVLLALGSKIQHLVPVVHYCDSKAKDVSVSKIHQSMKVYAEKIAKSDEFFKQQIKEFESGKEFLANMMGRKSKEMTQEDINNAIEYLFPSALYVPKARPMMKPPEELFGKPLTREFDENGRPDHYLFYTLKPKFTQSLHDAAETLERLNRLLYTKQTRPKPLLLVGGGWLTQLELQEKFSEKVYDIEYEKFLEIFNKLKDHPFAAEVEGFIRIYWKSIEKKEESSHSVIVDKKDDLTVSLVQRIQRKTSFARVSVSHPGSGKIRINNMGLDYFLTISPREQVSLILIFNHRDIPK